MMKNKKSFKLITILKYMDNRKYKILLVFLIVFLFVVNYNFVDSFLEKTFLGEEFIEVDRVIDGDTVVVNGNSMRLLGINCPEKGEIYSSEATEFLKDLVLNKTLRVERYGKDKYFRELVYLFDSEKNINLEIVKNGFANYYFPEGKTKYYHEFVNAWNGCLNSGKSLCEKSFDKCAGCVVLKEFENQKVVLENVCGFDCDLSDWSIKDEGRKKFVFENFVLGSFEEVEITERDFGVDYVWTSTGDTLFLRDSEGRLVLWESY